MSRCTTARLQAPAPMTDMFLRATIRPILRVLDQEPVLSEHLLELGSWIAEYYLAPLGEVLRTMLPLGAEVRQRNCLFASRSAARQRCATPQQRTLNRIPAINRNTRYCHFLPSMASLAQPRCATKLPPAPPLLHQTDRQAPHHARVHRRRARTAHHCARRSAGSRCATPQAQ